MTGWVLLLDLAALGVLAGYAVGPADGTRGRV